MATYRRERSYLIRHGENGMVYPDDSYPKMEEVVRYLMTHPKDRSMSRRAYDRRAVERQKK